MLPTTYFFMKSNLKDIFYGFAFGLANIIPGVSGGTFALVLGFYERLIGFINRLNAAYLIELLKLKLSWLSKPSDAEKKRSFFNKLQEDDWFFILRIAAGAILCIVLLSAVMEYVLKEHFEYTYAFFFGLIIMSICVPWKLIGKKSLPVWINILLGLVLTVAISASVNPYDKTMKKSDIYQVRYEQAAEAGMPEIQEAQAPFSYAGNYKKQEYVSIFIAGFVAISAMILPGISGSLLLILLGQYYTVISAISNLRSFLLGRISFFGYFCAGYAFRYSSYSTHHRLCLEKNA